MGTVPMYGLKILAKYWGVVSKNLECAIGATEGVTDNGVTVTA